MHRPPHAMPIAVIGMAVRLPQATDVEQYWANLLGCACPWISPSSRRRSPRRRRPSNRH
ncbi:beta-ketoacyl synthase N-terminal-like domain-containing protein [Catellatospora methionotrophica]|uniref:beta-ketoacyl synthase N-terminal-like domain-containing protein n=1 Tax=Catellatospora methionotrophica TaxID=121620 RepID=UPI0033DAE274